MAGSGNWIFSPESQSEAPVQVRDLASLIHRLEFRYDLHLEDLTLLAAGPHTLPALTWVAITQPELRAMVLIEPELDFEDAPSREVVRRLVESAHLLDTPTHLLLREGRPEVHRGPIRDFFENLGCDYRLLSTIPASSRSWLAGLDPEVALRKVNEFTRGLRDHVQAEVA